MKRTSTKKIIQACYRVGQIEGKQRVGDVISRRVFIKYLEDCILGETKPSPEMLGLGKTFKQDKKVKKLLTLRQWENQTTI